MPKLVSPAVSAASVTPMPPGTGATLPTMPAPTCTHDQLGEVEPLVEAQQDRHRGGPGR